MGEDRGRGGLDTRPNPRNIFNTLIITIELGTILVFHLRNIFEK